MKLCECGLFGGPCRYLVKQIPQGAIYVVSHARSSFFRFHGLVGRSGAVASADAGRGTFIFFRSVSNLRAPSVDACYLLGWLAARVARFSACFLSRLFFSFLAGVRAWFRLLCFAELAARACLSGGFERLRRLLFWGANVTTREIKSSLFVPPTFCVVLLFFFGLCLYFLRKSAGKLPARAGAPPARYDGGGRESDLCVYSLRGPFLRYFFLLVRKEGRQALRGVCFPSVCLSFFFFSCGSAVG